ncbi:MAG: hypothetical protein GF400_10795 [Candidatus Eisenbacteria bacterium]|nr:hypothetical protein [Candidatus Eisenbacteria bacterium]
MHQSKWEDLIDQIDRLFGFVEHTTEEFPERHMTVETAIFDGASGRMMLERSVKPLVIDKKVTYSKRAGTSADVEYVYSEDEFVDTVKLFTWDKLAREWKQIDISALGR